MKDRSSESELAVTAAVRESRQVLAEGRKVIPALNAICLFPCALCAQVMIHLHL